MTHDEEGLFADLLADSNGERWLDLHATSDQQAAWQRLRDDFVALLPAELAACVTVELLRTKLNNERRAIREERLDLRYKKF